MSQPIAARATIQGNVSGQVAVGSYILQVGDIHGGIVQITPPSRPSAYSARAYPINLRPRAYPSLLDREEEFEAVRTAFESDAPVCIYGEAGIGKTSFVRQLAHLRETERFPHGVVYLAHTEDRPGDFLQHLFDAFYESQPEFKPAEVEILHALRELQALIILDDLILPSSEVLSLLNSAPHCAFILTSVDRSLWGEGQIVHLQGLPAEAALKLFERELGRSLSEQEHAEAKKIVQSLQGHPLRILQAASLVRERSIAINELVTLEQSADFEAAILQATIQATDDSQKGSLAILSAAGGNALTLEHLAVISHDPELNKTLQKLISLGLVEADGPHYRLTGNLASTLSTLWDLSAWEDALVRYFIGWLEKEGASAAVEKSAEALIYLVKRAGEKKHWREVILLGRALERYYILWKRWQSWAELLDLILKAARALVDRKTEAWALHQSGTRAMCLENKEQARELLSQALEIRKSIKDEAAARVTQHNLQVLLRGSGILNGSRSHVRPWMIGGMAVGLTFLLAAIFVIVGMSSGLLPPIPIFSTSTATATPTHTRTATFTSTPTDTPTSTLTATSTSTPTSTSSPTQTPTFTATLTDTPTMTPNPPTVFSENPGVSPEQYFGVNQCDDLEVTISTTANDPSGVREVAIYYRLANKNTRTTTQWNNLPMVFVRTLFGFPVNIWRRTITSSDFASINTGEFWLQFYFVATDNTGIPTRSRMFGDRFTVTCSILQ